MSESSPRDQDGKHPCTCCCGVATKIRGPSEAMIGLPTCEERSNNMQPCLSFDCISICKGTSSLSFAWLCWFLVLFPFRMDMHTAILPCSPSICFRWHSNTALPATETSHSLPLAPSSPTDSGHCSWSISPVTPLLHCFQQLPVTWTRASLHRKCRRPFPQVASGSDLIFPV